MGGVSLALEPADDAAPPTSGSLATGPSNSPLPTQLDLTYRAPWTRDALTAADRRAGVVARARRSRPDATFFARVTTTGGPQPAPAALLLQTERGLAAGVTGYVKVSAAVVRIAGRDVVQIVYRQDAAARPATQTMLVVVPVETHAFYLTLRSAAADFPEVAVSAGELLVSAVSAAPQAG